MDRYKKKNKSGEDEHSKRKTNSGKEHLKRLKTVLNKHGNSSKLTCIKTERGIQRFNQKQSNVVEEAKLRLDSARFRYLNEKLYTTDSQQAWKFFQQEPESFLIYHKGFNQQVNKWPVNPLDTIITKLLEIPNHHVIGDFGCGEARLSVSVPNKVHSFDLSALNDRVTVCDMKNVPLPSNSLDVGVYCLSLMGSNLKDFLSEGNRLIKLGSILFIAEVESRCGSVKDFTNCVEKFGFKLVESVSYNFFFLVKFKKVKHLLGSSEILPNISLRPCVYKKR